MKIDKQFLQQRPLSQSSMKQFMKSPAHYLYYLEAPREKTDALILGSAVDSLIFTEDEFISSYAVGPECDRRTKDGKATWEAFLKEADRKTILTKQMYELALAMREGMRRNQAAMRIFEKCDRVQARHTWTDRGTKLPLITIMDAQGKDIILSLKTAQNAEPDDFSRTASNYHYSLQAAFEMEAARQVGQFPDYYYVVIEKSAPYCCSLLKASDSFLEYGKVTMRRLLDEFTYCLKNNLFTQGYEFRSAVGYTELELPGYLKYKLQNQ